MVVLSGWPDKADAIHLERREPDHRVSMLITLNVELKSKITERRDEKLDWQSGRKFHVFNRQLMYRVTYIPHISASNCQIFRLLLNAVKVGYNRNSSYTWNYSSFQMCASDISYRYLSDKPCFITCFSWWFVFFNHVDSVLHWTPYSLAIWRFDFTFYQELTTLCQ